MEGARTVKSSSIQLLKPTRQRLSLIQGVATRTASIQVHMNAREILPSQADPFALAIAPDYNSIRDHRFENDDMDEDTITPPSSCSSTGSQYPFPSRNPNKMNIPLCCPGCGNGLKWVVLDITVKAHYNVHRCQAQCSCEGYKKGLFEGPIEALYVPRGMY